MAVSDPTYVHVCYHQDLNCPLVPVVPQLTSVDRVSGLRATVHWIPLVPDRASGVLTQLRIAYQTTNSSECSHFNNEDDVMYIEGNLFAQSQVTINNLKPDKEYCVAIKVSTIDGSSGFSTPLKMECKFMYFCSR